MRNMKKVLACLTVVALVCAAVPAWAGEKAVSDDTDGTASVEEGWSEGEEDASSVKYLVVDKAYVEIGETQEIVLSIGDGEEEISSAALSYHNESDGTDYEVEASRIEGSGALFEIDYSDESEAGAYGLDSVSFVTDDGTEEIVVFSTIGIDAAYGVETEVETNPDALLTDDADAYGEDTYSADTYSVTPYGVDTYSVGAYDEYEEDAYEEESGVVVVDASGETISGNTIEAAIDAQMAQISDTTSVAGNVVVVLDPGHDATHVGAGSASGLREENLNLKIAQYCKEELETYDGVEVYMTRTTEACPFPGSDLTNCLKGRVDYAASVGATVYVALHLNGNESSSAHGSQVYYPNKNYDSSISEEGYELAVSISEQLAALGLTPQQIYSVDSSSTRYPDGSMADYYAVIRRSKLAGFPGIIVEHAFMTNASDVANYMSSEEALQSLGVADATGIANYFGLTKSSDNEGHIGGHWAEPEEPDQSEGYTGFLEDEDGWWYVENDEVQYEKNSVIKDTEKMIDGTDGWWYVVGGKVQTDFTGLANYKNANGWWYIVDGKVDFTAQGVYKNVNGWWYVEGGKVIFTYNGFAENENGLWYLEDGKVTFSENNVIKDTRGAIGEPGIWYYVVGSQVQTGFTGLANYRNANGWWYITDGMVDFTVNTVAKNVNGWWYVVGGKVQFGFTGLANYKNANGWWYIVDGKVDFTAEGVYANVNGSWYVKDGKVDFTYYGIAENEDGWWYIRAGQVDFSFNGTISVHGTRYTVVDGKVKKK